MDSAVLPLVHVVDVVVVIRGAAGDPEAWLFAGAASLGSVSGSLVLLRLSRQGRRFPGLREITKGRAEKYVHRVRRYPTAALFVAAVIPAPFPVKALVVAAGLLKVSAWRVGIAVAAARTVRYFGLAWLGRLYGESILHLLSEYRWALAGGLAVALAAIVGWWAIARGRTAAPPSSKPDER